MNQNFKNQMWAAQTNNNNARVTIEKEILNRDYGVNSIFNDLTLTVLFDSIPEKVDSLLNYVLQKGTLSERMVTSPVFINEERFVDAQSNLSEVSFLNINSNPQITDFIELQQLQVQLNQLPDSMRKDFIIQNESWLSSIAYDSTNFYQADGLTLLEEAYDTLLNRNFYLGGDMQARVMNPVNNKSDEIQDCGMSINPNPARNIVEVKINSNILAEGQQIIIYDLQGKKILINETLEKKEKYSINISNFIKGNYYVVLKSPETILCVRKLIIE